MISAMLFLICATPHSDLLVATDQVSTLSDTIIVDARSKDVYETGHISASYHVDASSLAEKRGDVTGLLKPVDQMRDILGKAGIDPAKRIVVYSAMAKADDLKDAARLFWILEYLGYEKVSVLDGGFAKWVAEDRPVEIGPSKAKPIALPALMVRESLRATAVNVDLQLEKGGVIADFRGPEFFSGEKKVDAVKKAGHIPGAINVPADTCIESNSSSLKSWEELQNIAKSVGIDGKKPIIAVCNTGRSASTGYLVLRLLGYDNVAVYDGSMSDWTATESRKVETGTK